MNKGKKFESSITGKSRLLCGDCNVLRRVADVDTHGDTVVQLICGHKRGELLPLRDKMVSIEHVERGERIGYAMFPAVRVYE